MRDGEWFVALISDVYLVKLTHRTIQTGRKMAEILELPNFITKCDIRADSMLREIAKSEPDHAFVICWPKDAGLPTYHSTTSDMPIVLMNLQKFMHRFYNDMVEHENELDQ